MSSTWLHLSSDVDYVDDLFSSYLYSCYKVHRSVLFIRCTFVPTHS